MCMHLLGMIDKLKVAGVIELPFLYANFGSVRGPSDWICKLCIFPKFGHIYIELYR